MNDTQEESVWCLLEKSTRARKLARNTWLVRETLKCDTRKVLPVAFLAREFSTSVRLLWNWIGRGLFQTEKKAGYPLKPGVTKEAAIRFLDLLDRCRDYCHADDIHLPEGRPPAAMEKIRKAWELRGQYNGLRPNEFAGLVGVSRSTVMRAIKNHPHLLPSWKPTPARYRIGKRSRIAKKSKNIP